MACDSGFYWDAGAFACAACPGAPPPGTAWGDNCSAVFDCDRWAALAGVALPARAHWPAAAAGPAQCVWKCDEGYLPNGGLCCAASTPGLGLDSREWVPRACATRCRAGLFAGGGASACVPCIQYLRSLNIDYCQR